jgi:hypothetical protein
VRLPGPARVLDGFSAVGGNPCVHTGDGRQERRLLCGRVRRGRRRRRPTTGPRSIILERSGRSLLKATELGLELLGNIQVEATLRTKGLVRPQRTL